ncbi:MAG: hypothetical protein M1822_010105 [Bathelium mastoideum]|nr:MAG: hypothetical protein M1822_010105 [Bathelium mastoideum]
MKLCILSSLAFLAASVLAQTAPQKAVMVTYKQDTPNSVLEQAKAAIEQAGGLVTHEFKLIKGFAASAPAEILESVQAWGTEHEARIEEDQTVYALGESS